jgi:hypothetical protein
LCRYSMGAGAAHGAIKHWHSVAQIAKRYGHMQNVVDRAKVRRCRLTLSNPRSKRLELSA